MNKTDECEVFALSMRDVRLCSTDELNLNKMMKRMRRQETGFGSKSAMSSKAEKVKKFQRVLTAVKGSNRTAAADSVDEASGRPESPARD